MGKGRKGIENVNCPNKLTIFVLNKFSGRRTRNNDLIFLLKDVED